MKRSRPACVGAFLLLASCSGAQTPAPHASEPAARPEAPGAAARPEGARAPSGAAPRTLSILSRRKEPESLSPITPRVAVTPLGYRVTASAKELTPGELSRFERFIPLANGRHDAGRLGEYLHLLKQRFPRSRQAIVSTDPSISYATIVATLDAMRRGVETVDGKPRQVELFPDVVFSVAR